MRATASKAIVYTSPYVPPEWIAAHGFKPMRMLPRAAWGSEAAMGRCRFAQAYVNGAVSSEAAATIFTTTCDQMRRVPEIAVGGPPLFLLNIPATWQSPAARDYYRSELLRLGDFLIDVGGSRPSASMLTETVGRYDRVRRELLEARASLKGSAFARMLTAFQRDNEAPALDDGATRGDGVPIAFLGGPFMAEDFAIFDLVEANGGEVVLDATTTGERTLPAPMAVNSIGDDPLEALVHAYFDHIPDAFRRPNTQLYEWFSRECAARGVQGVVLVHQPWCDIWKSETARMQSVLTIPLVTLSLGEAGGPDTRAVTRIQAFMEALL